ncbi:MAG: hypothetical protein JW751_04495 [Polyangiaceae bacterium]|nr:hypothetical protein [Polyangiaceae bacterium]
MARARSFVAGTVALAFATLSPGAGAQCYVDSEGGDDANDGLTEATPIRSQDAIPAGCNEIRYARGSVFYEPVAIGGFGGPGGGAGARTVFTKYGDPALPLPAFVSTETVVSAFQGGVTIDGLHLEGTEGACVSIGGNSQLLNNDISHCAAGIMLMGENTLVQGNVVHDLDKMLADSTDPDVYVNAVGGAEGIFINGSNNEIAYNSFINCKTEADWVTAESGGVGYDGGATEVAVLNGEITGVRVHHNFAYNSCGFFEVSGRGVFRDSEFYYNVAIDSAWLFLLQVNETTLQNISWTNNTVVHHADSYLPSVSMIYQGEVSPGTVSFTNNLVIFAGAQTFMADVDANIAQTRNLIVDYDPGVRDLAGITAEDFDLVAGSPAIDAGQVTAYALDYLNRTTPDPSGLPDIGAFEFGSEVGAERPAVALPEPERGTPPGSDDGGCSCGVAPPSKAGWPYFALLALGGLLVTDRRDRRRGARYGRSAKSSSRARAQRTASGAASSSSRESNTE